MKCPNSCIDSETGMCQCSNCGRWPTNSSEEKLKVKDELSKASPIISKQFAGLFDTNLSIAKEFLLLLKEQVAYKRLHKMYFVYVGFTALGPIRRKNI